MSNRALYTVWIVSMSGGDQFPPQGPLNHHLSDCTRFHSIITLIFIIIVIIILNIEINIWVSSLSYSRQFMTMILFSIQLVLVRQLPWKFLQYSIFFTNHTSHNSEFSLFLQDMLSNFSASIAPSLLWYSLTTKIYLWFLPLKVNEFHYHKKALQIVKIRNKSCHSISWNLDTFNVLTCSIT